MGLAVNKLAECTLPEKILLAGFELEEQGQSPFSAEALIVAAWQKYPRTFGLKGYEELYPDSNKVLAGIMGEKGLPKRGWMEAGKSYMSAGLPPMSRRDHVPFMKSISFRGMPRLIIVGRDPRGLVIRPRRAIAGRVR